MTEICIENYQVYRKQDIVHMVSLGSCRHLSVKLLARVVNLSDCSIGSSTSLTATWRDNTKLTKPLVSDK